MRAPGEEVTRRKRAAAYRKANFYRRFRGVMRVVKGPVLLPSGNAYVLVKALGRSAIWMPTSYDAWRRATAGYAVSLVATRRECDRYRA